MTKKWLAFPLLLASFWCNNTYAETLLERNDVQTFIQEMQKKHDIDPALLRAWFKNANIEPSIIAAMQKPYEALPWHRYQPLFVTQSRIDGGVEFYNKHQKTLKRAEKEFGVPEQIIIAILGVESRYGQVKGGHPVFNALVTLGFGYPPRAKFFLTELEEFLLLAHEEGWDPKNIKGSYAGAMGQAQFISSSYRRYAIDYNGDGKRDLINNADDAIGSIANYFKIHGWKRDQPVVFKAQISGSEHQTLEKSNTTPKPQYQLKELNRLGVAIGQKGSLSMPDLYSGRLALIELEEKNGPGYWLGTENFYAITRYNHSNLYAMAVYELSEKIKAQLS